MKTYTINTRIDFETLDKIQTLSETLDVKKSDIVRDALTEYFKGGFDCEKDDNPKYKLLQSLGFTELIFWLYEKARNPEVSEIDELYIELIEMINELNEQGLLKPDIQSELAMVTEELNQILYNKDYRKGYFDFVNSFNYEVLADFMYTLRYDDDNNQVIHIK